MRYRNYSSITWCTKQIDPPHRFQKLTSTFFDFQKVRNLLNIFLLVPHLIEGAEILSEHVPLGGSLEKKIKPPSSLNGGDMIS